MESSFLKSFLPEIFLSFSILFHIFLNSIIINKTKNNFPILNKEMLTQILFILICIFFLILNTKIKGFSVNFLFLVDTSSKFIKLFIIISIILCFLPIIRSFISQNLNFFEFFSIFLISLLASLLLTNTADMLSLYLIIELQTLCFYILATFRRNSSFSVEAGLKYFIFGAFISGIFLFGCNILFACVGTLNLNNLNLIFSIPFSEFLINQRVLVILGISFITVFFLFKIAVVPFHFWVADVYEGSPLATTIIFSILPKFPIFYVFYKWFSVICTFTEIKGFLLMLSVITVFFGSFFAIKQQRLKRFVIYSSISQTGFLIACSVNINHIAFSSLYFFLIVYIITSILIWTHISLFSNFQNYVHLFRKKSIVVPLFLTSLSNFFFVNKLWAFSLLFISFSLSGIPPLVGFLSKILVLFSLINSKELLISLLLLIISSISVFYYLRLTKIVFFEDSFDFRLDDSQIIFCDFLFEYDCLLISFLLFLIIFLFFFPSLLIHFCFFLSYSFFF